MSHLDAWGPILQSHSKRPINALTFCAGVLALLLALSSLAFAADATSRPFKHIVQDWTDTLDRVELQLRSDSFRTDDDKQLRAKTRRVRQEARDVLRDSEVAMGATLRLLDAMGSLPENSSSHEATQLAEQRKRYLDRVDFYKARQVQAEIAIVRADQLEQKISREAQDQKFSRILDREPFPLAPSTLAVALPEFAQSLTRFWHSPVVWWSNLTDAQRDAVLQKRITLVLVLALGFGFGIRHFLLKWFGRDIAVERPSYTRRLGGAIAEGVASGVIPALIFAGFYFRVTGETNFISGLFEKLLEAVSLVMIFVILAWALPRAVLAPNHPNWRLLDVRAEKARMIASQVLALAAIFAIDIVLRSGFSIVGKSEELNATYTLFFVALQTLGAWCLARAQLWSDVTDSEDDQETTTTLRQAFWTGVRRLIMLVALVAFLTAFLGYANLAATLIYDLLISAVIVSVLFLLRGLLRELIGFVSRSLFLQKKMGLRHRTRSLFKVWTRGLLDVALLLAGFVLVVSVWGAPFDDVWFWAKQIAAGFQVGGMTISVVDIVVGIGVFVLVLILSRLGQRVLAEKVLPGTRLDSGLQNSLAAGWWYLGIVLAIVLGIAAIGIDLSSIALIAGALSVGIGFGLQNIANNFISGLILLIERPVKVGDWVVLGQNEGFVKQINLRSTEIETFQKASVILPNADIISNALINWTHKDRYGRIEVGVTVALNAKPEEVRDIMLAAAAAHPRVVTWPESFVLFRQIDDSGLFLELRCFTADVLYQFIIGSDLRYDILQRLREAKIEIPMPQRVIHQAGAPRPFEEDVPPQGEDSNSVAP